jgi:hypothetical protein
VDADPKIFESQMNPKERFLAVYSDTDRQKLDRVPTFVQSVKEGFITKHEDALFADYNGELLYTFIFDPALVLGFDAVFADVPSSVTCKPINYKLPDGKKIQIGMSGQISKEGSTFYHGGVLQSLEILNQLWANIKVQDHSKDIKNTKDFFDSVSRLIYPVPMIGGIFDTMWMAMGMNEFSKNYRQKSKLYYQIIKFYAEITTKNVEAVVDVFKGSQNVINILDDVAFKGRCMIPADRWDSDFGKYYKIICKIISDAGLIPQVHTDGDISELIPSFQRVGFRGLQGWEGGMNPFDINAKFPNFVVIGFGDVSQILPFGSPEQIDNHVKQLMDALKENRHYVCGPSTVIVKEMPLDNVRRFMAAVQKLGQYN